MRSVRAALVAVCCLIATTVASADPTPADIKKAKQLYKLGEKLIAQQRYDEAIRELEAASILDPGSDSIYNLGVAYHLKGDESVAIEYYRLFLLDAPAGKSARKATSYLAQLEKKQDEARADQERRTLAEAQTRNSGGGVAEQTQFMLLSADADSREQRATALESQVRAIEAEQAEEKKKAAADRTEATSVLALSRRWERRARQAPSAGGRGRRLFGAVALFGGAAAVTWGTALLLARDPGAPTDDDADVLLGAGAGGLLLGFASFVWGEHGAHAPRSDSAFTGLRVAPTVGRGGGGLTLQTRF